MACLSTKSHRLNKIREKVLLWHLYSWKSAEIGTIKVPAPNLGERGLTCTRFSIERRSLSLQMRMELCSPQHPTVFLISQQTHGRVHASLLFSSKSATGKKFGPGSVHLSAKSCVCLPCQDTIASKTFGISMPKFRKAPLQAILNCAKKMSCE